MRRIATKKLTSESKDAKKTGRGKGKEMVTRLRLVILKDQRLFYGSVRLRKDMGRHPVKEGGLPSN